MLAVIKYYRPYFNESSREDGLRWLLIATHLYAYGYNIAASKGTTEVRVPESKVKESTYLKNIYVKTLEPIHDLS